MTSDGSIRVLYDGDCPLCTREANWWVRLDRGRGRVELIDIAAPEFDAEEYGLTRDDVMAQIHAILPDGRVITGMEVFRRVYGVLGWGWLVAPTGWWPLRYVFDAMYRWFARNRLRLTGRVGCDDACRLDGARGKRPRMRESDRHGTDEEVRGERDSAGEHVADVRG